MLRAPVGGEGSLFPPGEACEEPIAEAAPRLVWRQLKKALRYDRRLDRLTPENQHELRIECKRLRYTAEFLADIYPGRLIGVIVPATALQDELGDVHDADVYRDRVLAYCERRRGGADAAGGPARLPPRAAGPPPQTRLEGLESLHAHQPRRAPQGSHQIPPKRVIDSHRRTRHNPLTERRRGVAPRDSHPHIRHFRPPS